MSALMTDEIINCSFSWCCVCACSFVVFDISDQILVSVSTRMSSKFDWILY